MRVVITLEDGAFPHVHVTDGLAERTYETTSDVLIDLLRDAEDTPSQPWIASPLLPPQTVFWAQQGDTDCLVLDLPAGPQPWVLPDGQASVTAYVIPLPRLLFLFLRRKQHVIQKAVVAVNTTAPISPDTPLFAYPLSNVYDNTTLCWTMPDRPYATSDLLSLAHAFFATPNNWDLTQARNASGLDYRALGAALADRDTFPPEWLVPLHRTWADWIAQFVPQAAPVADAPRTTPAE
jgi:hypothetical protein